MNDYPWIEGSVKMTLNQSLKTVALSIIIAGLAGCSQAAPAQPTTAAATSAVTPAPATAAAPTAAATSAAAAAPTSAAGPRANPIERINGTIQSFSNGTLTLSGGKSFTVSDKTRIIRIETAKASDLKSGDYVAVTAKRQPDNTLLASIVNVFPDSMKGVGVGQRPMTGGNLMTNATIDQINGSSFTVTFPGGGAHVTLAPDAQVNKLIDGSQADLKEGATASAAVLKGIAQSISVH